MYKGREAPSEPLCSLEDERSVIPDYSIPSFPDRHSVEQGVILAQSSGSNSRGLGGMPSTLW